MGWFLFFVKKISRYRGNMIGNLSLQARIHADVMAYPVAIILRSRRPLTEPDRKVRSIHCIIIFLLARGYIRKEIAARLSQAEQVIKNHLKELYACTGCSTHAELVSFGFFAQLLKYEGSELVMVEMKEVVVEGWKLEGKE